MASKKLYLHFETPDYIEGKSDLLKVQMEILCLKKIIKNLSLTRQKKVHYQQMLGDVFLDLKKGLEKLDKLMPEDEEISRIKIGDLEGVPRKAKKKVISKKVSKPSEKPLNIPNEKKDDIEEELLRIKKKLESLNRV